MWLQFTLLVFFSCQLSVNSAEISCDFLDTVNITSGYLDQHGSFHHDGIVFIKGSFAEFDYVFESFTTKTKVESHIRGCVCKFKPCIRICCRGERNQCVKSEKLSLPLNNGIQKEIDLNANEYGVLVGQSCKTTFDLMPEEDERDAWTFSVSFYFANF